MKTTYATKKYLKSIGGITGCYPMGKGEALFKTCDAKAAKAKAESDGWDFRRLPGVGHDYNFGGDIYVVSMASGEKIRVNAI